MAPAPPLNTEGSLRETEKTVQWFSPKTLLQTARESLIARLFSGQLDWRRVHALRYGSTSPSPLIPMPLDHPEAVSFDYVADFGEDNSTTQAIANELCGVGVIPDTHSVGHFMIFGGDCVYPFPSYDRYLSQTVRFFDEAERLRLEKLSIDSTPSQTAGRPPRRRLYALPGNHDWYDSLTAFSRIFIGQSSRENANPEIARGFADLSPFQNFRCPQDRSYFAVRLPRNWWILAFDLQLNEDIDGDQMRYFTMMRLKHGLNADSHLIVLLPEPFWIRATNHSGTSRVRSSRMDHIECALMDILGIKTVASNVIAYVTGDMHHYARLRTRRSHVQPGELIPEYIIAGGGGAHLHPTHVYRNKQIACAYPDSRASKRLAAAYPIQFLRKSWNSHFYLIPGFFYGLTAWLFSSHITYQPEPSATPYEQLRAMAGGALSAALNYPSDGLWFLIMLATFYSFTGLPNASRTFRLAVTSIHSVAHMLAVLLVCWTATGASSLLFAHTNAGPFIEKSLQVGISIFITAICGAFLGTLVTGVYLWLMLRFGIHGSEAFSALGIYSHKSFLRFRITSEDQLEITAIGIENPGKTPSHIIETVVLDASRRSSG